MKLYGVIPPMVTPFTKAGAVDIENLEALVDHLSTRVDGLFVCGSYGSGPLMSPEERMLVAETCMTAAKGRLPIIVHSGAASTGDAARLSVHAAQIGAAAASAVAPYYFHHNAAAVFEYYQKILAAVPRDFPFYVYHNPRFSGYEIEFKTIEALQAIGIAGIKDATFDIAKFALYMRELAPRGMDVVLGTESMWLSARALGAEAYIPGLASAFPELCVKMHRQGMANDFEGCRETQFLVNKVRDIMYLAGSTQQAVYTMLKLRGIVHAYPRSPFVPSDPSQEEKIREALAALGVL
jgi:dihydrodipicolinate synthase/N-acetylneuraminate lyase